MKRYIYAVVISEQEDLGPFKSMYRSLMLSKLNGWDSLRAIIYFLTTIILSFFLISSIISGENLPENNSQIFNIIFEWFIQIGSIYIALNGYKESLTNETGKLLKQSD